MKTETQNTYPDYKTIRIKAQRIDCTITEADFNTHRPNPYRIDYMVSDINRHFKRIGDKI